MVLDSPEENPNDGVEGYMQEACYYLRKKGLTLPQISKALEVSEKDAELLYRAYESKVAHGIVQENEVDRNLWEDMHNDSQGNEKITFARDDGLYHCRRSDLETMDSPALMSIFETSKKFLDFDMYKGYLNTKPPVGYDPMALQRQVKRAMDLIQEILDGRWKEEPRKG
ncbi:hypothetical protein E6H36_10270 [Candidatus Bathyarchaeota archaeon]|nr:MAG: hypothetical protein E6H36_10270 [Candidatus Bathyarchaeota archaeon]